MRNARHRFGQEIVQIINIGLPLDSFFSLRPHLSPGTDKFVLINTQQRRILFPLVPSGILYNIHLVEAMTRGVGVQNVALRSNFRVPDLAEPPKLWLYGSQGAVKIRYVVAVTYYWSDMFKIL